MITVYVSSLSTPIMKQLLKNFGIIIIVLFLVASVASLGSAKKDKTEESSINTLVQEINNDEVQKIEILQDTITVTLKNEEAKPQVIKKEIGQ